MVVGQGLAVNFIWHSQWMAARPPSIHGFTGGILPGTIELDQSTGKEKLYLISCEHPFGLSNEANIDDIIVPKRCVTSAFEINKLKP